MNTQSISVWGHGQLLAFSGVDGPTSYEHGLCLRSIGPGTAFKVVLPGQIMLEVDKQPPVACDLAADHLDLTLADGRRLRGAFVDHETLLLEGPLRIVGSAEQLHVLHQGSRTLISSGTPDADWAAIDLDAIIRARRWWVDHQVNRLGLADRPTAVKALRQLKGQINGPEGIFRRRWSTPDRWPHRDCWLWDSAFHAIGARHVDAALARDCIEAVLDGQYPDGMLPIRSKPTSTGTTTHTQPPTLTLATWAVSQLAPDPAWLRQILPRLEASLRWNESNRMSERGLPIWAIDSNPNCRSGESGLDNSTRFDAATRMEAVDFASFMACEWELMARLWRELGEPHAAETCARRHEQLCQLIRDHLWDETAGLFRDWDTENSRWCPVLAVTGFLPLICGAATHEQAARLAAHLDNPETFGTALPLPSVARGDDGYEPDMWRGPVWVNMVHLVAAGFARYGQQEVADRLRGRMVAEIEARHAEHGTFFEFFDADGKIAPPALPRKGRCAPEVSPLHQAFHDYGWTGTLYLDLVLAREPLLPRVSQKE